MSEEIQILQIDTLAGKKPMAAPRGWTFNKTDKIVWVQLCARVRDRQKPQKLKRSQYELEAKIDALAIVLANSLGMASHYWMVKAAELCNHRVE